MPLDTTIDVETPEHIRFRYRAAGPARRALAYLLDLLVRAVIGTVLALVAQTLGLLTNLGASGGLLLLVLFALEWGYYVVFESLWSGRTVGKRALNLRVVREGGHPVTFVDSLLRNLLRAADFLPVMYVLGALVMIGDSRFRRLGDRVAGTQVVVEEPTQVVAQLVLSPRRRRPSSSSYRGGCRSPLSSSSRSSSSSGDVASSRRRAKRSWR